VPKENITLTPFILDLEEEPDAVYPSRVNGALARTETFLRSQTVKEVLAFGGQTFFSVDLSQGWAWTEDRKTGSWVAGSVSISIGLIGKNGAYESAFSPWTLGDTLVSIDEAKEAQGSKKLSWAVLIKRQKGTTTDYDSMWASATKGLSYTMVGTSKRPSAR